MDWEVFWRTRSPSLKEWVRSLNKQAGLPHRATCIKIIHVIRLLVQQKLHRIIKAHAAHRMAPHSGTQCDIWSEKSARNSFFCMRQSMILEPELVYEACLCLCVYVCVFICRHQSVNRKTRIDFLKNI